MIQGVSGSLVLAGYAATISSPRQAGRAGEGDDPAVRAAQRDGREKTAQDGELTAEQQRQIAELKATDQRVRAHEQAHLAVGGDLVRGGASYSYATGPDGRRYAVGGEVSIDTSPARTPEATIPKARHIREAALAPVDPSPQDQSVAAAATRMEEDARRELAAIRQSEARQKRAGEGVGLYAAVQDDSGRTSGSVVDATA